ncbi:MAG: GMC family oxidoreductase N-terminal domain-containing protein [Thermomicrobiales bacterium]
MLPKAVSTVVVGAGPAGAVVAARLAEAGEDVLVLEAGPDYGAADSGRWPAPLLDPTLMPVEDESWEYTSSCALGTPAMALQRARVIGGCSSHNGCAAVWGHWSDYDAWAVENPGWSAADLEPLFRTVNEKLRVHVPPRDQITPFHQAVLAAAEEAGYPRIADLSSLDPVHGFAIGPINIDPTTRIRWNAAFAYLDPLRALPNLRIEGDTLVDKVTLNGTLATGVDVIGPEGPAHIDAERVILAAGAYGSPLILLRSGIGAAAELNDYGITPQHDLPAVGKNLHDHPAIGVHYQPKAETVAALDAFAAAGGLAREEGTIGLARSRRCAGPYDLHLYPVASRPFGGKGWQVHISAAVMAPRSRGTIRLNAEHPTDPEAVPDIDTNYFSDLEGYDLDALADAFVLCRDLGAQPALAALFAAELAPGPRVHSREAIYDWIRHHATHDYHPAGSCRMGPASDPTAVVDASGRVHGLAGLLVVDAAIMPFVTLANTNVPTFVGAEKIARDLTSREA